MSTTLPEKPMAASSPKVFNNHWPVDFSLLKSPPAWLAATVTVLLILSGVLLLFFALVAIGRLAVDLLSTDPMRASDATRSLLPIAAAAVGLPLIVWRLVILSTQTRISEAKTQIDRETHYTSIFSKSVEQLGQTREFTELRDNNGVAESASRTVPNIEVRLGGIHSLTRLAEESARHVGKIENMLRSYVRENSWSDRSGLIHKPHFRPQPSPFEWYYDYQRDQATEDTKQKFAKWSEATKQGAKTQQKWPTRFRKQGLT